MEPTLGNSPTTLILLVSTSIISLIGFSSRGLWRFLALEPFKMKREKEYHAIVTSGFVHGSLLHLAINMIVLFFFGPTLEEILGSQTFLAVYSISLVTGSVYPLIKFRDNPEYIAIGASGAISGLIFSYCLFLPFSTIYLFAFFPMPAVLFAVLYVVYTTYAIKRIKDNIGHEAHLAGAVGGIVGTIALRPEVVSQFIQQF